MSYRTRANHHAIFSALAVGALAYAISQTMLIPSLPEIEAAFNATPGETTTLMTSFWISGAVTAGLFGRLGDMFGKRRMIATQLVLFTVGALICATAPSLGVMIVGRVLMGCAIGLFPLAYSLIRDEFPRTRVVGAIALLAGLIASGAVIGQSIGGLISDQYGFRMIFWVSLVLGVLSVAALEVCVPESPVRTGGRVDVGGAALLASGLAAPLIAIAKAPTWGWGSAPTLGLLTVGAVLLGCFARYERRVKDALIDIPTLLLPRVRLTNAATLFVGFGLFGVSTILAQFYQEPTTTGYGQGANATQAGLFLVPGLLLLAIVSPLAGRLSTRVGPVFTFRLGIAVSTMGIAGLTVSHSTRLEMYGWPALIYTGIGATFGAMPTIILQGVSPEHSGQSTAINMILRTAGSAIGIQLAATVITMSVGASGAPTDRGYTAAFALATSAGLVALFISLRIPREIAQPSPPNLLAINPPAPS